MTALKHVWLLSLLGMAGCTLMKSTMLTRFDDNSFAGQSNGVPQQHGQPRPFRGVPVALKVPTHVDVAITETYFLYLADAKNGNRTLQEAVFDDPRVPRNLDVKITPIMTKKLFTVDFVRPAAGTLDYKAEFTNDQYFSSIENTIVDETIQDITAAIKTVAPSLGLQATAEIGTNLASRVATATRTVAYARFDIDAPDFEEQLNSFVLLHVTGCHGCQGRKTLDLDPMTNEPVAEPIPPGSESSVMSAYLMRLPSTQSIGAHAQPVDRRKVVLSTPEYTVYAND